MNSEYLSDSDTELFASVYARAFRPTVSQRMSQNAAPDFSAEPGLEVTLLFEHLADFAREPVQSEGLSNKWIARVSFPLYVKNGSSRESNVHKSV